MDEFTSHDMSQIPERKGFSILEGVAGRGRASSVNNRISPLAGISGAINRHSIADHGPSRQPATPTAPSIVEGHSVAVQSPARKNPGQSVCAPAETVQSRHHRKGRPRLLQHSALHQLRPLHLRKKHRQLPQGRRQNLLPRHAKLRPRACNHQLHVTALLRRISPDPRLVKKPLNRRIQQPRMIEIGNLAVKPEQNRSKRRMHLPGQLKLQLIPRIERQTCIVLVQASRQAAASGSAQTATRARSNRPHSHDPQR